MSLTPPEKCKYLKFAHLLYTTCHFMQTSTMNVIMPLEARM